MIIGTELKPVASPRFMAALALAAVVHDGQVYHMAAGDVPYIVHCLEVAGLLSDPEDKAVALLHDVFEDSQDEKLPGHITATFGYEVYRDLLALTRGQGETYVNYIRRCAENPRAARVKHADLTRNLAHCAGRAGPEIRRYASLAKRYIAALKLLEALVDLQGACAEQDQTEDPAEGDPAP